MHTDGEISGFDPGEKQNCDAFTEFFRLVVVTAKQCDVSST